MPNQNATPKQATPPPLTDEQRAAEVQKAWNNALQLAALAEEVYFELASLDPPNKYRPAIRKLGAALGIDDVFANRPDPEKTLIELPPGMGGIAARNK